MAAKTGRKYKKKTINKLGTKVYYRRRVCTLVQAQIETYKTGAVVLWLKARVVTTRISARISRPVRLDRVRQHRIVVAVMSSVIKDFFTGRFRTETKRGRK